MHRIDHPTADITTVPGISIYTEGNPSLGVPATVVTDDWLNDVQENIIKVITQAGISLTKGRDQDLYDAIMALANTESGSFSGAEILTANRTITGADKGKYFHLNANTLTVSLPDPATLPLGFRIKVVQGANTNGVVSCAAGNIWDIGKLVTATSHTLTNRSSFDLIVASSTLYHMVPCGGGANMSSSGFQYLPSGLLIQWTNVTISAASSQTFSFPNTFPNAVFQIVACDIAGSTTPVGASGISTSQFTLFLPSSGTKTCRVIAIGN